MQTTLDETTLFSMIASGKPLALLICRRERIGQLHERLTEAGYYPVYIRTAEEARMVLHTPQVISHLDMLVIERGSDNGEIMELARDIKTSAVLRHIPVVMVGKETYAQMQAEWDAELYHYLPEPTSVTATQAVLERARKEAENYHSLETEMLKHRNSFQRMDAGRFHFWTLEHVEQLSCLLANCYSDPSRTLVGLTELMINAVEHGILGITYEQKGELMRSGRWLDEIRNRQDTAGNTRRAEIEFSRCAEGCHLRIKDPGDGFEWKRYLGIDPTRITDMHGRGIALSSISFDTLVYNDKGNEVSTFVTDR